ncbi:hypothetical protein M405DRAFT_466824 [Rhizopogon salebrosus TDB-379]|nr:hypothetical protein M405DRAFT_466824 [Rhizopogon salebrosus TDB-379]
MEVVARTDRSIATRNISTIPAVQLQRLLRPNSVEQRRLHRLLDNTSQVSPEHLSSCGLRCPLLEATFIAKNNDYYREFYGQAHSDVARASNWDSDVRSTLGFIISPSSEKDTRSFNDFTWLVDYPGGLRNPDDHEVVTHVLLVLSGMRQLGELNGMTIGIRQKSSLLHAARTASSCASCPTGSTGD